MDSKKFEIEAMIIKTYDESTINSETNEIIFKNAVLDNKNFIISVPEMILKMKK